MASRGCRKRRAAAIKAAAKFGDQLNPNERLEDGSGKTTMDNVKAKETVDRLSRKYMLNKENLAVGLDVVNEPRPVKVFKVDSQSGKAEYGATTAVRRKLRQRRRSWHSTPLAVPEAAHKEELSCLDGRLPSPSHQSTPTSTSKRVKDETSLCKKLPRTVDNPCCKPAPKRRQKRATKQELLSEYEEWVARMNKEFEEVDKYKLVIQ